MIYLFLRRLVFFVLSEFKFVDLCELSRDELADLIREIPQYKRDAIAMFIETHPYYCTLRPPTSQEVLTNAANELRNP